MVQASLKNILVGIVLSGAVIIAPKQADAFVYQDRIATSKSIAHYAMGQVYDLLGLTNRAVMEYEKASQFDSSSYLIYLRLGADYARLGLLPEAKESLKLVNKYNPDDMQSHYLLALIHSTLKEYDEAANEYETILKSFSKAEPKNIEIYGYLGQLYYSQRKYDQAIKQFEKILELEPVNSDIMYLLGSLYLEVNNEERSIELLKKSIQIDPDHDGSLNTLGYIYAESGEKLDEAFDLISRALKINPKNGAYLDSLGWVYFKLEKYEDALSALMEAKSVLRDPVIYDHLGDIYMKLNRIEDAIDSWKISLELRPDQKTVQAKIDKLENSQASR